MNTTRLQGKQNRQLEYDSERKHDNTTQKWEDEAKTKGVNLRSFFSGALTWVGCEVGGSGPPFWRALTLTNRAHVNNTI